MRKSRSIHKKHYFITPETHIPFKYAISIIYWSIDQKLFPTYFRDGSYSNLWSIVVNSIVTYLEYLPSIYFSISFLFFLYCIVCILNRLQKRGILLYIFVCYLIQPILLILFHLIRNCCRFIT